MKSSQFLSELDWSNGILCISPYYYYIEQLTNIIGICGLNVTKTTKSCKRSGKSSKSNLLELSSSTGSRTSMMEHSLIRSKASSIGRSTKSICLSSIEKLINIGLVVLLTTADIYVFLVHWDCPCVFQGYA